MSFSYIRRYTGPVEAVIFDNAGTLVDFGSTAPVMAFIEIFAAVGSKRPWRRRGCPWARQSAITSPRCAPCRD